MSDWPHLVIEPDGRRRIGMVYLGGPQPFQVDEEITRRAVDSLMRKILASEIAEGAVLLARGESFGLSPNPRTDWLLANPTQWGFACGYARGLIEARA